MNNKVRFMAVIVSIMLMFVLVACNNTDNPETKAPEEIITNNEDEKIIIRLGTATEPTSVYNIGADEFARLLNEYTNGKVEVEIYPSGQLGSERDLIEGVSLGTLEMTVGASAPFTNFSEDFKVFDLPYLVTDLEKAYEIMDGEVGQSILATLEPKGIKALGFWENGFRHLTNNKKEMVHPEDAAGMKIRVMESPIHIATWEQLKTIPTPMAWGEVFTALQQNTIDGQENPLVIFYTAKLYEVNKYLSMTSHCYSPSVIIINSDVFNSYPQDVQDAILRAEKEARKFQRETSQRMAVELVEKIKAEGVTITEVDVEEWKEACMPVYEKLKDEIKPELIEAFQ